MAEKRTVVLYPHLGPKAGTGHIKRLIPFFTDERFNVYIIHRDADYVKSVTDKFNIDQNRVFSLKEINKIPEKIDLILLDNKDSDRYLYDKLKLSAPIAAIDEGGDARDYLPYIIDTLPNLMESEPNYYNPGLLDLPVKSGKKRDLKNILVTFGGQDPYNLTEKIVDLYKDKYNLTTVIGPLFDKKDFFVDKIESPDNLKEILSNYDLIITSFGLTAFEAVASQVPVALLNPTDYHQELSRKAGFYCLDQNKKINYKKASDVIKKIDIGENESLTDFIYNLKITSCGCPVCNRKSNPVLQRFKDKTYFRCNHCKIDYMISHTESITYSKDYFFEEYKAQYGKTYLEDFDHIADAGEKRVGKIVKKLKNGNTILDIGCAYGPFMKAAEQFGLKAYGIDVSDDAVRFVNEELGLKAVKSQFPLSEEPNFPLPFDAVTMWFVIEHFRNLDTVLTQVNTLLKKGGVFAFSSPNSLGISGRKNYKGFLQRSPIDHFSVLNYKNAVAILKEYGFKVYKVNVTGHHPERFGKLVKGGFLTKLFYYISRVFKLGDTFEIYAIKENIL